MVKVSNQPLQPNPFTTYRDPKTGQWIVVKISPLSEYHFSSDSQENFQLHNSYQLLVQTNQRI
jgi:hypothetical protein